MKIIAVKISRYIASEIEFPRLYISLIIKDALRIKVHKLIDQSSYLAVLRWDIRRRRLKSSIFDSPRLNILLQNINGFVLGVIIDPLLYGGVTVTE
jgi:hypothetical protein